MLRFVASALRRQGYQVLEANGGAEALDVVQRHPGPVHLLLTDVTMPSVDGPSLWRSLNRQRPEAEVLFMSAHPGEPSRINSCYLRKPFSVPDLLDKVAQTIR